MSLHALVVLVPEADPIVGSWRLRYDRPGIPAHVTVMYPFLPGIPAAELADLFAAHEPFTATFSRFGRLPGLLYLDPAPSVSFSALTSAVTARWPKAEPYGGRYGDPVPHLTVAQDQPPETFDAIEADLSERLPFEMSVREVTRVRFADGAWQVEEAFGLGPGPSPRAS
ncbi:2'-5' RNA ligase family protein [Nonomuraea sp. NPDC050536]|uniref:2'-5' RNA ligase family protein n=1 Tax=Nonomuraea sp. NPDC050536 TaxID=3364366 RepID=UPI0037CC8B47